jgi:hypothetical protein
MSTAQHRMPSKLASGTVPRVRERIPSKPVRQGRVPVLRLGQQGLAGIDSLGLEPGVDERVEVAPGAAADIENPTAGPEDLLKVPGRRALGRGVSRRHRWERVPRRTGAFSRPFLAEVGYAATVAETSGVWAGPTPAIPGRLVIKEFLGLHVPHQPMRVGQRHIRTAHG